jgi:competence protein ComEA
MKKREIITGSIVILCIIIVFMSVGFLNSRSSNADYGSSIFIESPEDNNSNLSTQNKNIRVEIRGAVKDPGVYTLEQGSRVEDLILKAGGFTENADINSLVSQAKKLRDEDTVVVREKILLPDGTEAVSNNPYPVFSIDTTKININTASKEELMKIPGIGPSKAQSIIDYREKNGDFKSVEELTKVSGIGEATLSKMLDAIEAR